MEFTQPDPAERSAFMRLFYRNRRPTWFGHLNSQIFCWGARLGLLPGLIVALEVRHREGGKPRQDAVVISSVAGDDFIVSMFGSISDWVHDLEASRGKAVIYRSARTHCVRLELVSVAERAPIIREFNRIASSGRKHLPLGIDPTLEECAALAPYHPAYRIDWQ